MQINMHDVYDSSGNVMGQASSYLAGYKHRHVLLPNLHLLNQYIECKEDIAIEEEAQPGLYFSFLSDGPINSVNDINSVQVAYQKKASNGTVIISKGEQRGLLQIHISSAHLALTLGETEEQVIQHFSSIQEQFANKKVAIDLPLTEKSAAICSLILEHNSHSVGLAGQLYAIIFNLIEELQMLSHLSQCEECQKKLFHAQNIIETIEYKSSDINALAEQVGLNAEALKIGFYYIVGQPIEYYSAQSRIKLAAARLRKDPSKKSHIVAQSGFSEHQFEAVFMQYFGVSSHQYGQIH